MQYHMLSALTSESQIDEGRHLVYHACRWPDGRVVMQRFAKPCTSVQFRLGPPHSLHKSGFDALRVARHVAAAQNQVTVTPACGC